MRQSLSTPRGSCAIHVRPERGREDGAHRAARSGGARGPPPGRDRVGAPSGGRPRTVDRDNRLSAALLTASALPHGRAARVCPAGPSDWTDAAVTIVMAVLIGAGIVCLIAPTWLARLEASRLAPAAVLSCWWSAIAGVVLSAILATVLLVLPDRAGASPLGQLGDLCVAALSHAQRPDLEEIMALAIAGLLGALLTRLVYLGLRASARRRHHLRAHVGLLTLLGRTDANVIWLPHAAPMAFSIAGREPVIVATSGLRTSLSPAAVDAVLAHERAHLLGRHHLQVALADALAAAVPGVPLFRDAPDAVRRLVEFAADSSAAGAHGSHVVAQALGVIAGHDIPPGALSMSGSGTEARLLRLASPPPRTARMPWIVAHAFSVGTTALLPTIIGSALVTSVALLACS